MRWRARGALPDQPRGVIDQLETCARDPSARVKRAQVETRGKLALRVALRRDEPVAEAMNPQLVALSPRSDLPSPGDAVHSPYFPGAQARPMSAIAQPCSMKRQIICSVTHLAKSGELVSAAADATTQRLQKLPGSRFDRLSP